MQLRPVLALAVLALLPVAATEAQPSPPPAPPSIAFSPTGGDPFTGHTLLATGLPANTGETAVLFDPLGNETVLTPTTDGTGSITLPLRPPSGAWNAGLYRAVLLLANDESISATFGVSAGAPALYTASDLPSPSSSFLITGTGLPASQFVALDLTLAGGYGARRLTVATDAAGTFSTYVWPEMFGFSFWSAGRYSVVAADTGAQVTFWVREHPGSAYLSVNGPVIPGNPSEILGRQYAQSRYLWTVYGDSSGKVLGEFLLGPTDFRGVSDSAVVFPSLPGGRYLLATPYDWGETPFDVTPPTATATATSTITPTATATSTPRPTATRRPTPRPTATRRPRPTASPVRHWCKRKGKRHKVHCR